MRRGASIVAALLLAATALLAALAVTAARAWVGRPFPGFLLLANRVVAPVAAPGWPVADLPDLAHARVVAVDDQPVASAAEVYARVRLRPAGALVTYGFASADAPRVHTIPSQRFGWPDALLVFGPALLNGLAFAAIGVGAWALGRRRPVSWALLAVGLCTSVWALTGPDQYGPHALALLHALAGAFLPGTLVHLALVFPVRRASVARLLALAYLPAATLALATLVPPPADGAHAPAVTAACIGGGLFVLAATIAGARRARSELVRQRARFVLLAVLAGIVNPGLGLTFSALGGTRAGSDVLTATLFVFPLAVACAVRQRDLLEMDLLVRRGARLALLTGVVSVFYLGVAAAGMRLLHGPWPGDSLRFSLAFAGAVLLLLPALRTGVGRLVDLLFARPTQDLQEVLARATAAFGATLSLDVIVRVTRTFPATTLPLARVAVFLRIDGGFAETTDEPRPTLPGRLWRLDDGRPLTRALALVPRLLARDALPGGSPEERAAIRADFDALGAEVIVPLACQGVLMGFLVCGRRSDGAALSGRDLAFLHTFASQAALSLQNASTYHDLEVLNADLEARVAERTEQVKRSLAELEDAYRTLEASKERLVAAEKMAAFGRLAAGIAHEVNTPLGAALNGLRIARELVGECREEAAAPPAGGHESAALDELGTLLANVEDWTRKAAAYIKSVKSQGRSGAGGAAGPIDLGALLERDIQPLLLHRLRLAGSALELRLAPDLPELHGDGSRLGQVIANLIDNAIDASAGLPPERNRIIVEAVAGGDAVVLRVRDHGSGMPEDVRARIFDDFYTTKPPGIGTGLGLSIARDIVTGEFGGTVTCTASGSDGSTFTIRLPLAPRAAVPGGSPPPVAA